MKKDKGKPKKEEKFKEIEFRNIKPARVYTFSLPDDVADELDKLKERGMKSKVATEAFRQYFVKQTEQPAVEIPTEEEILKKMLDFINTEPPVDMHYYRKEVTKEELERIFNLPFLVIHEKILPILKRAGYKVLKSPRRYY